MDRYNRTQIERSDKKWFSQGFVHNTLPMVKKIIKFILDIDGKLDSVCCMGIRCGNEYKSFKEMKDLKDTEVYGIDINPKVVDVGPNCYCFNFNKFPKDWENKFELIYTNSLDHAENIKETLDEWHRITNKYIWLDLPDHKISETDIHTFDIGNVDDLIDENKFNIIKIWENPEDKGYQILMKKI